MNESEKIGKFIAHAGICSRRQAEDLVIAGRIKVNDIVVLNPSQRVIKSDIIKLDNKIISKILKLRAWIFHKPRGFITSSSDPQGRQTIYDILPNLGERVISVGRLDYNSEGLLILTNNGEFSRILEMPSTGLNRKYRVRIFGILTLEIIQQLKNGVEIDGIHYKSITIEHDNTFKSSNQWITVTLLEGKNREIRRVLEYFNIEVSRLIRISYGPFELHDLEPGRVIEITSPKLIKVCQNLGFSVNI
jgi:23S rRNA pseudouridine2605 synthase